MNDLIVISNMDSTPSEELLHSVEIDDVELEALDDDNPFFDLDTEEVPEKEPEQTTQKVIIPRRFADYGPGSQKIQWYYKQDDAFENYVQGKIIISADTNSKNSKKFCVLNHDEIEPLIFSTPVKFRNFYEMAVHSDSIEFPVKLYYDYDMKGVKFSDEKKQEVLDRIINETSAVFKKHFDVELQKEQFVLMDSTSEIKTSMHLVLCGYHFKNVQALLNLMGTHLKPLIDEFHPCLDLSVYRKNSHFRMLECCKFKEYETPFLHLTSDYTFEDALITKIPEYSQLLHVPEQELQKPKKKRRTNYEMAIVDVIIDQLCKKYQDTTSTFCLQSSKENSYYFKTNGTRVCPLGYTHQGNNFIVQHDVHKGALYYICLSPECSHQRTLLTRVNGTKAVEEDFTKKLGVKSDFEAAERVLELSPHWVCCNDVLYAFDNRTGMWSDNKNVHYSILSELKDHLHLITWNDKECQWKQNTKGYGNDSVLIKKMMPFLQSMCIDDHWLSRKATSSLGFLLFKNGYIDMSTGTLHPFDPDIVFFARLPVEYRTLNEEWMQYMQDVKERFFDIPLGKEVGDFFLLQLARALAGDVMKKIMFGIGPANNGKSTFAEACQLSFGDYVGNFNAETLSFRDSNTDEAANMRWVLLLQYKRIIFSNELKNKSDLDGNFIKKISSGGDRITARVHCGNETEIQPHFLACVMANDLPRIKPYDEALNNRVRVINYEKIFVDNPTNQFEVQKDDNIKNEMKNEAFQRVFVMLFIKTYVEFKQNGSVDIDPPAVLAAKENWIGNAESISFVGQFLFDFEITDDEEDFIKSSEINEWIVQQELGITVQKFTNELKKHCILKKFSNVRSKLKKLNGRPVTVWVGLKRIKDMNHAGFF